MFRRRTSLSITLALVALLTIGTFAVLAHAEYDRSEPPAGAVVPEVPTTVHVWFTQELFRREGENWLEVYGPDSTRIDNDDAYIDDDDRTHMTVTLQTDVTVSGTYTVAWRTLSAEDGDTDSGEFTFTVDSSVTQMTPPPSPTTTPMPATTATTPASPTPASGTGGLPCFGSAVGILLLGIVAVVRREPDSAAL